MNLNFYIKINNLKLYSGITLIRNKNNAKKDTKKMIRNHRDEDLV